MGSNLMQEMEEREVAGQCNWRHQYFPPSLSSFDVNTSPSSSRASSWGTRASHIPNWPCLSVGALSQYLRPHCHYSLTSKEDKVLRNLGMIRRGVNPVLHNLGPSHNLQILQLTA